MNICKWLTCYDHNTNYLPHFLGSFIYKDLLTFNYNKSLLVNKLLFVFNFFDWGLTIFVLTKINVFNQSQTNFFLLIRKVLKFYYQNNKDIRYNHSKTSILNQFISFPLVVSILNILCNHKKFTNFPYYIY